MSDWQELALIATSFCVFVLSIKVLYLEAKVRTLLALQGLDAERTKRGGMYGAAAEQDAA